MRRYSKNTRTPDVAKLLERAPVAERESAAEYRPWRVEQRLGVDGVAEVIAAYEAGASVPELQQRFGSSKSALVRILREAGVEMRRQPVGEEDLAAMVKLYESGLSIREVAANLGFPKTTVQNALAKTEVVMRPARRVEKAFSCSYTC
jgi:AraC-like DNA-binding protein